MGVGLLLMYGELRLCRDYSYDHKKGWNFSYRITRNHSRSLRGRSIPLRVTRRIWRRYIWNNWYILRIINCDRAWSVNGLESVLLARVLISRVKIQIWTYVLNPAVNNRVYGNELDYELDRTTNPCKVLNGIKGLAIGIVKALPDEVYQLNDREYNCVTNLSPNLWASGNTRVVNEQFWPIERVTAKTTIR